MATVLIIDDDGDVRDTFALVLEDAGHQVLTASSGTAGAAMFRAHRPELVITDMIMPGSDGIEAIRAIRAVDPAARIIASSGASFAGPDYYLNLAMRFGAIAVLPKPFEANELLRVVETCLSPSPAAEETDPPR